MLSDFLILYDESAQKITGIPFYLDFPKNKKINFIKLSELLEKETVEKELNLEEQFGDLEKLILPDIFGKDGKVYLKSTINNIWIHEDTLFGNVTMDHLVLLYYRDKIIVVVQTSRHKFQIITDTKKKKYFVIFYCSRTKYKHCYYVLRDMLFKFGISLSTCQLHPKKIEEIREELNGDLIDTTLIDFPSNTIDKKRIIGKGFQTDPDYLRDAEVSKVHQHMFNFKPSYVDTTLVVTVSGDGLVRFYNNVNYRTFVYFLKNHILDRLIRAKEAVVPIVGFLMEDLFEDEEDEVG